MKIVHVAGYYQPAREWGGPVRSVALLVEALGRAGASVEVLTTNARGSRRLCKEPPGTRYVGGVPVTYCEASGPRRFFFSADLTAEIWRRVSTADVVHIHGLWTYPVVAAARACERHRVPYVLSPRGSLDPWALRQKSLKKRAYLAVLERHTIRRAALLHFTTDDEHACAPSEFRSQPHVVVPNCLELDEAASEQTERALAVPEILILGRIHPMKGFDLLVPALRRLADAGRVVDAVVAGNDENGYRAAVERLAAQHRVQHRIRFVGEVDGPRKNAALRRALLLVAPSYRENFGNAVAEAMALGLPVVVSERVGIAADIAEHGAGLVVPLDPAAIAAALERLLADPALRAAMGKRGRELVRTKYSKPAVAEAMLRSYEQILRQDRPETMREDTSTSR